MAWDKKYYLNINDQNVGPLNFEEIADRIKNGLLKPEDYIFVIGDKDWQNIRDLEEFKLYVGQEDPETRKAWFIRKNKQNEGPYSKKEILDMIETGRANINDYVWSKELRNWTTIQDAFMIQTPSTPLPEPKPELPVQEKAPEPDMDNTPVMEIKPQTIVNSSKKRMLPELILGSALLLVGLYQSQTKLITAIILSTMGALLLLISIYEGRNQQGDK